MRPRQAFPLLCLLATTTVQAEIYRCEIDGRTTYRDRPCPAGEKHSMKSAPAKAWEGCYAIEVAGWESGRSVSLMRITGSGGQYTLSDLPETSRKPTTLPTRRATPGELRDATRGLGFEVFDALVMIVPAGTPNQPAIPIGLYKGRDAYRDIRYFFFGFLGNGPAKPAPCP